MKRAVTVLAVLASLLSAGEKKRKQSQPPELEVAEAAARRVRDRIEFDGIVRNISETPLVGLVLKFEFLSSGIKVMTVRKGPLPEKMLDAGDECAFAFQMTDEPRAVQFRIGAFDEKKNVLRVVKPGPYPIE